MATVLTVAMPFWALPPTTTRAPVAPARSARTAGTYPPGCVGWRRRRLEQASRECRSRHEHRRWAAGLTVLSWPALRQATTPRVYAQATPRHTVRSGSLARQRFTF